MYRKLFVFLLLLCIGSACDSERLTIESSITPQNTETSETIEVQKEIPLSSTPSPKPSLSLPSITPTPLEATVIPTETEIVQGEVIPARIKLCPQPLEVLVRNFNIDNLTLIIDPYKDFFGIRKPWDPFDFGAFILSLDNFQQQAVPNTASKNGLQLIKYGPSNDGRSIELLYKDSEKSYWQVWHSSWNGKS